MREGERDRTQRRASDAEALANLGPAESEGHGSIPPLSDPVALGRLVAAPPEPSVRSRSEASDDGRLVLPRPPRVPHEARALAQEHGDAAASAGYRGGRLRGRQGGTGVMLGAVFGVAVGLAAGWVLFGMREAAPLVAAERPAAARADASEHAQGRAASRKAMKRAPTDSAPKANGPKGPAPVPVPAVTEARAAPSDSDGSAQAPAAQGEDARSAPPDPSAYRSIDRPTTGPRHVAPPPTPAAQATAATPSTGVGSRPPKPSALGDAPPDKPIKPQQTAAKPAAEAADVSAPPRPPRSVDRLLDEALGEEPELSALERAKRADRLPDAPSKDQLVGAMKVLLPAIRACAMGQKGLATVALVIANSGRVQSARMTNPPFAGTAAGHCMEGVARKARFPKFQQPFFKVRIPFALQ